MRVLTIGFAIVALSSAALAFEEQKLRPAAPPAPTAGATSSPTAPPGAALTDPGIATPRVDSGTKIRVPGLGVIGEIPKMDFGLELLYGASQPKGPDTERNDGTGATGVMGRVTVPLKPAR